MFGMEVTSHKYVVAGLEGPASALVGFENLEVFVVAPDMCMSRSALEDK